MKLMISKNPENDLGTIVAFKGKNSNFQTFPSGVVVKVDIFKVSMKIALFVNKK